MKRWEYAQSTDLTIEEMNEKGLAGWILVSAVYSYNPEDLIDRRVDFEGRCTKLYWRREIDAK